MPVEVEPWEPVRLATRPHGIALTRPLVRTVVAGALGAALVVFATRLAWPLGAAGVVLLALGALNAIRAVLAWDRTTLLLTDRELVVLSGVVRRRSAAVRLAGTSLEVDQTMLGRLLDYGTLVAGDLEVPYVPGAGRLAKRAVSKPNAGR
ncbi:MAG: PH domain-containing protein [Actinomycetota bacterium]|nr:PH domain-containing protein [Actinomycetota bacterium]